LRLARLVVEQGWPIVRAAERFQVSWQTTCTNASRNLGTTVARSDRPTSTS
jgi:hypothetical protein